MDDTVEIDFTFTEKFRLNFFLITFVFFIPPLALTRSCHYLYPSWALLKLLRSILFVILTWTEHTQFTPFRFATNDTVVIFQCWIAIVRISWDSNIGNLFPLSALICKLMHKWSKLWVDHNILICIDRACRRNREFINTFVACTWAWWWLCYCICLRKCLTTF